jgi:putative transposase
MWTQAHRATYKQSGTALPSDLTEAQWERLKPLIPAAKSGGRARKTDKNLADTLAAFVTLAAIQFAVRRLARL